MAVPTLIYCAGGNKRFYEVAVAAGYKYGSQLPETVYGPLYFADQDWKKPDRARYIAALAEHRPEMATVLDWEREEQLPEVLSWAEEIAQYVERILIIPKVQGGIKNLPRKVGGREVVLAYSVPTKYGGTELPLWDFLGWPTHLLGGSPHAQMKIFQHLPGVISVDGNMHNKMAHFCRFWREKKGPKGHFVNLNDVGEGDIGRDANLECFRRSCENIMEAWRKIAKTEKLP